ncbi:tetratricopeptide repeat protein [Pendulispora rubella]|uniref:Tetratricopeptide repeat protein n=1 Tax=Pendulispora rubella TaxID=2741070 RepID=A0ABZ2L3B1_9BACT
MADKGRWSIVNPAGEEVTFESRDDLKRAVLDDEIEPHAESIPPDPPAEAAPADAAPAETAPADAAPPEAAPPEAAPAEAARPDERPAVTQSNRPTPFMGEAEVLDAEARASVSNGRAAMLPSESEIAEDAEPPSSAGEMMDEPTLQYSKPLSVPPMPSRKSPPEDESSPLSLSEVGGVEAPPSVETFEQAERSDDDTNDAQSAHVEKIVISPDDSVSLTLPLVGPGSVKAVTEGKDDEDDEEDDDEKTAEMEVEASELEGDDGPQTLKRPSATVIVREPTPTPPPLPVNVAAGDRRSSKPALPPLPASTRASAAPPLQRLSPPPRISLKPETIPPVRGSITRPSLPPPDIIPDGPPAAAAPVPAPATAAVAAKKASIRKPSWIVPIALVGVGIAFWLGTKSNHVPAPESATKDPKPAETQATPTAEATPVAVSSSTMATPAPSAAPEEPPHAIEPSVPSEPATASAAPVASTPPASVAPSAVPPAAQPATPEKPATPRPSASTPSGPPGSVIAANDPLGPMLRRAAQVQRNGDYGTARQIYQQLLQKEPKNPEVLAGLGDTSRALGDKASARSYYARALDASSSFLPALLGLADTEWDLGDRAAAQKHYAAIVEHHTNAPERARQRAKASVTP